MLRRTLRSSARLLLSAAISWTLIPIAIAEPPEAAAGAPQKRLHTVPEDGMGDKAWLSGANSIVRSIMAKRPDEDLVICVAGCVAPDRVVYAQPAEKPPVKEESAAAEPAPAAKAEEKPVAKAEDEMPDTAAHDAKGDEAGKEMKAEAKDGMTPAFEPTASANGTAPALEPDAPDAPAHKPPVPEAPASGASSNTEPN